jgi:hypothetical protein
VRATIARCSSNWCHPSHLSLSRSCKSTSSRHQPPWEVPTVGTPPPVRHEAALPSTALFRWAPFPTTVPAPSPRHTDSPLRWSHRVHVLCRADWHGPTGPLCRWARLKTRERGPQCGPALCVRILFLFIFVCISRNCYNLLKSLENGIQLRKMQNQFWMNPQEHKYT